MTTLDARIAQFENMAQADPSNDMAHFSLGSAYLQAGRAAEAARSFERCLALNAGMSKAYQLAGEAMIKAGWSDRAVEVLEQGYEVAVRKGDVMPRDGIAALLRSIGRQPPAVRSAAEEEAERLRASGVFVCKRTGRPGTQLDRPPMRGPVGEWIQANVSAQTWREWVAQGTKVINELRLDFSREEDQRVYDEHMREYLGIDREIGAPAKGETR
jgi:Fe-S cluster biosynthesis and repair protein YggX